jgi:serine/threonine-protein kinase
MAYEILTGQVPFPGPDFRAQHLTLDPPAPSLPVALASIVIECLYKAPGSRPTAANVVTRLPGVLRPASGALARLQAANQAVVVAGSKAAAAESAAKLETERRTELYASGSASLKGVIDLLSEQIREGAPATGVVRHSQMLLALELNQAALSVTVPRVVKPGVWHRREIAFDVIACSRIRLHIPRNYYGYAGRSHSLWFCDGWSAGVYRWFETAFMHGVFSGRASEEEPFAFDPGEEAAEAIGPGIGAYSISWPPTPIDQGEHADFIEQWIGWFASAGLGELNHPPGMPERQGLPFRS